MRSLKDFWQSYRHSSQKTGVLECNIGRPVTPSSPAWRALYMAAVFETDERCVAHRIAEAKNALGARARELFLTTEDHLQEESDINEAYQALQVLENCLVWHGSQHAHLSVN